MKFYVYHNFNYGIVFFLCHNLKNRIIDEENGYVYGFYNDVKVEFYFQSFSNFSYEELSKGYHVIHREEAVKKWFYIKDFAKYQNQLGFPDCLKAEYHTLFESINFDEQKWILFWNFGENKFVHLNDADLARNRELKLLRNLSDKSILFSDNYIKENTKYSKIINSKKLIKSLTNDVFMWNHLAQVTWASEFSNIYKNLSPPNNICISFRSYKPHRFEIIEKLSKLNLKNVHLSYSSALFERFKGTIDKTWGINYDEKYDKLKSIENVNLNNVGFHSDIDFKNVNIAGNKYAYMELDYYFRILPQAKIQLLDETHSYISDESIPMNLSEKTYILLLANIPFISTHHYPLDLIREHILDLEHPYYSKIKKISNNVDELVKFIEYFNTHFDRLYPKLKEWTNKVHIALLNKMENENSFLEHMTTKI